jgi:hypothetical protein
MMKRKKQARNSIRSRYQQLVEQEKRRLKKLRFTSNPDERLLFAIFSARAKLDLAGDN